MSNHPPIETFPLPQPTPLRVWYNKPIQHIPSIHPSLIYRMHWWMSSNRLCTSNVLDGIDPGHIGRVSNIHNPNQDVFHERDNYHIFIWRCVLVVGVCWGCLFGLVWRCVSLVVVWSVPVVNGGVVGMLMLRALMLVEASGIGGLDWSTLVGDDIIALNLHLHLHHISHSINGGVWLHFQSYIWLCHAGGWIY